MTRRSTVEVVDRTLNAPASAVQDVGVDHGRFDDLMPEEFLDSSDIVATFQQMCRR